jgi:hypothetical protein
MKVYYYLLLLLLGSAIQAGELYKVINEDGSITYTDVPKPGAKPLNLTPKNTAVMPSLAGKNKTAQISGQQKKQEKRLPNFSMRIISPAAKQTIRNNLGQVSVHGEITPSSAGQFQLYLDNVLIETKTTPSFELENVDRGEHSIQIKFLHNSGKILASTPEQVFYLHKASALINAN